MREAPVTHVLGPSHAIRWSWHVRDGVVRSALPAERIIGFGGAPVWSKRLFEQAQQVVSAGAAVGLIVGDFRFGNSVLMYGAEAEVPLFQDGYLGIDARAMTREGGDARMRERGIAALRVWQDTFGDKVCFLFWDLFGRQVHDRMAGRHISGGRYRHPTFNYAEIVAAFPRARIADLEPLLRRPMHELQRLFIDASNHPSQIGYLLMERMFCGGQEATDAYQQAVTEVEAQLLGFARRFVDTKGHKLLLTGRSVWLDTFANYMGESLTKRLAEAGIVLAPLDRMPGQPSLSDMLQLNPLGRCSPVVLSAGGRLLTPHLARAFETTPDYWDFLPHIDWETATIPIIEVRGETPRHVHRADDGARRAEVQIALRLRGDMVEQGPLGMPSYSGLCHLLDRLIETNMSVPRPTKEY